MNQPGPSALRLSRVQQGYFDPLGRWKHPGTCSRQVSRVEGGPGHGRTGSRDWLLESRRGADLPGLETGMGRKRAGLLKEDLIGFGAGSVSRMKRSWRDR